jgi:hypothetical protein
MKFLASTPIVHAPGPAPLASLELFQSDIAPVLRPELPDPPWPGETVADPALAGSAT